MTNSLRGLKMLPATLLLAALGALCFLRVSLCSKKTQSFLASDSIKSTELAKQYKAGLFEATMLTVADDSIAAQTERWTLKEGIVKRQPSESDTKFLARVLPISYPFAYNRQVVAYPWRPTPFGKQLFFSRTNGGDNEYDMFLYILDPFQSGTYAVQAFDMGNMGDLTTVAAIFFADIDQDGRKELLTINECHLKEIFKVTPGGDLVPMKDGEEYTGETLPGRVPHYETHVFQYIGVSNGGRPRYREDFTPRNYLDELPTAAAVRQAIIKHQQKAAKRELP